MLRVGIVPGDYPEPVAADWPDLLEIVRELVKPERDVQKREANRERWWIYCENWPGLYSALRLTDNAVVRSLTSSHFSCFTRATTEKVFDQTLVVWASEKSDLAPLLISRVHEIWTLVFGATLEDRSRYSINDCFQTFPFPPDLTSLRSIGETYEASRRKLATEQKVGLTKIYNRLHNPLDRKPDIVELRRLHAELDEAVLRAYGWDDLADMAQDTSEDGAAPRFLHRTDEPEFAYEERYHWPAWFRDKVLARLLELNRARAAEEVKAPQNDKMKPSALQLDQQGTLI